MEWNQEVKWLRSPKKHAALWLHGNGRMSRFIMNESTFPFSNFHPYLPEGVGSTGLSICFRCGSAPGLTPALGKDAPRRAPAPGGQDPGGSGMGQSSPGTGSTGQRAASAAGRDQAHSISLYIRGNDSCHLMLSVTAFYVSSTAKSFLMQQSGIGSGFFFLKLINK